MGCKGHVIIVHVLTQLMFLLYVWQFKDSVRRLFVICKLTCENHLRIDHENNSITSCRPYMFGPV